MLVAIASLTAAQSALEATRPGLFTALSRALPETRFPRIASGIPKNHVKALDLRKDVGSQQGGLAANLPARLVVRSHSGLNELGVHAEARLLRTHLLGSKKAKPIQVKMPTSL